MDYIEKWLKSLRLHKYTHLFEKLTYEQMLDLQENFLIDLNITKGARNKMLVSIRRLNQRPDKLISMPDELDQRTLSLKEALSALKDMLITPIPPPKPDSNQTLTSEAEPRDVRAVDQLQSTPILTIHDVQVSQAEHDVIASAAAAANSTVMATPPSSTNSPPPSSSSSEASASRLCSLSPLMYTPRSTFGSSLSPTSTDTGLTISPATNSDMNDPYSLTHLFVETFEEVARRLIDSAGMEDNACHGIMAAIVDDCLKHNSFTKEQKARVACFKQHFAREQRARAASLRQHVREQQKTRMPHYRHQHSQQQLQQQVPRQDRQQYHQGYQSHRVHANSNNHYAQQQQYSHQYHHNSFSRQHQYYVQKPQVQHPLSLSNKPQVKLPQNHASLSGNNLGSRNIIDDANSEITSSNNNINTNNNHRIEPPCQQPQSLSASLSTIGSPSTSDEEEQQRQTYPEYSLLGPGQSFELPCLRALATAEQHNRRQMSFFTEFQSKYSC